MASIETLPAPLPLQILKELSDLKSLDALRRSSPCFNAVFRCFAVEVLEHLMQQTLLPSVIVEFRVYILLLLDKADRVKSYEDFDKIYAQAQKPLARQTPTTVISLALRTFTFHASACCTILQRKLQHLEALPHERPGSNQRAVKDHDWINRAGTPYTITESWPPDWIEEQRTLCATLRMLNIRYTGCSITSIPLMRHMTRGDIWRVDEMEEMSRSFRELRADGTLPQASDYSRPLSWDALAAPRPVGQGCREVQEFRISSPTKGFGYFHDKYLVHGRDLGHPIMNANWAVFRRLGVGIWSSRRLSESLHLIWCPGRVGRPSFGASFYSARMRESLYYRMFIWWRLYEAETDWLARNKKPKNCGTGSTR